MTTRPSPPPRPAPSVPSTPPEVKTEVKEENADQQQRSGFIRAREDEETPQARSVRRRLRVQEEFNDVLLGYMPLIAEYAAGRKQRMKRDNLNAI